MFLENEGYCPVCEADAKFEAPGGWLRDSYKCTGCGSIPRERALMKVINTHYPEWKTAVVHESSPGARGATVQLRTNCENYIPSQYFPDKEPGSKIGNAQVQNLEALTFEDESIDLHISQDVLEHVFDPAAVFSEIERTLKPGGMHIFTAPLVNKHKPTVERAKLADNGEVIHLLEPSYHGNPVGDGKSLVVNDWGFDICEYIFKSSGLFTQLIYIDDINMGIRAEYIEVLVTKKPNAVAEQNNGLETSQLKLVA